MEVPISIIILTLNEEENLGHCLHSLVDWAGEIFVVDSGSTDRTREIAAGCGATVVHHDWTSYPDQLNWALENLPFANDWIFRLDADERVTPDLAAELAKKLPALPADVTGLEVKRRIHFKGRWIKHGGLYPTWLLRLVRRGCGYCENRVMDEHLVLTTGRALHLDHDIIDENHKDLGFWLQKHARYAELEMREWLNLQAGSQTDEILSGGKQARQKRWVKNNLYYRLPPFGRAFFYFFQRYVLRLGFLDGVPGLVFHVLQGFWYRFFVDARIWEAELKNKGAHR